MKPRLMASCVGPRALLKASEWDQAAGGVEGRPCSVCGCFDWSHPDSKRCDVCYGCHLWLVENGWVGLGRGGRLAVVLGGSA